MLIHITDQSRMRMVRDAPDTLRAHDKRHRAPTLGLAGGIAGFFAPCGDVASNRTNFRSPVAYYAILTNDRITHMPGHIFAATNKPTNGACAARTAKNAPHPEQTTHLTRKGRHHRDPRRLHRATTCAIHQFGSRGQLGHRITAHARQIHALEHRGGASRRREDPTCGRRPLDDVFGLLPGDRVRSLVGLDRDRPRPVNCGTRVTTTAAQWQPRDAQSAALHRRHKE